LAQTKSNDALPFGGKSNKSFDYASLFGDKPSFSYWLVVASVRNEDFKGQTIDSPAKQCPVQNDDLAIENSLQICVPMIPTASATLTAKSTHILAITTALSGQNLLLLCEQDNSAITMTMATCAKLLLLHCDREDPAFIMATHAKPKLQLIVECLFLLCNEDNSETMTSSLLLFCVKDALAIMTAPLANFSLQLIVETPSLLLLRNFECPSIKAGMNSSFSFEKIRP
jgi:hypothetical protein